MLPDSSHAPAIADMSNRVILLLPRDILERHGKWRIPVAVVYGNKIGDQSGVVSNEAHSGSCYEIIRGPMVIYLRIFKKTTDQFDVPMKPCKLDTRNLAWLTRVYGIVR